MAVLRSAKNVISYKQLVRADLHLFQTWFVIGWKNNRDGDITMPVSLKTIGSAGYRDQGNKWFGWMQVNRPVYKLFFLIVSSNLYTSRSG